MAAVPSAVTDGAVRAVAALVALRRSARISTDDFGSKYTFRVQLVASLWRVWLLGDDGVSLDDMAANGLDFGDLHP